MLKYILYFMLVLLSIVILINANAIVINIVSIGTAMAALFYGVEGYAKSKTVKEEQDSTVLGYALNNYITDDFMKDLLVESATCEKCPHKVECDEISKKCGRFTADKFFEEVEEKK